MNSKLLNGHAKYTNGAYVLEGVTPKDVARAMIEGGQKEPFFLYDIDEALKRIQHFKQMMPRVQIFYAIKANDSEKMLKLAVSQGLGFDCASPGEIKKIIELNVNPLSILYAMPTKTQEQMEYARESGVQHTTFDTSYELIKIKKYWPDAKLIIRIRVDGDSAYKLGEKFGCDFETEAVDLLEEAAALDLKVVGVAFHVGSICTSIDSYVVGLRRTKALFDHEARAGRSMKIIDIGGGFISDKTDRIDQVSKLVNRTLEELFPDPSVQVIAEPGRYICDSSTGLYCSICNIRNIRKDGKPVNMFYINEGFHGSLRFTEPWHTVQVFKTNSKQNGHVKDDEMEAILWGPTADSGDRIMENKVVRLPSCKPTDWLLFDIQGAYSFGFATFFACLEKPAIRSVVSSEVWNQIKDSPVFKQSDFVLKPDLSAPLPSTLPPLPNVEDVYGGLSLTTCILHTFEDVSQRSAGLAGHRHRHLHIEVLEPNIKVTDDKVSKLVNRTLEELFPDPSVQVIAEPGRYLCDSSTGLYCSICNIRNITKDGKPVNMFYINEGFHGSLQYTEDWHTVKVFKTNPKQKDHLKEDEVDAILWGPTCDTCDRIMENQVVRLPSCKPTDWLLFDIQGAYSFGFASSFSCMEKPAIRSVVSSEVWNKIKDSPVFKQSDFVLKPDLSAPLPSTLPPLPNVNDISKCTQNVNLLTA